jgi:hypothetical protein
MLSVRDIQGQWREKGAKNEWTVDGIVVEKAKAPKGQKKNKPIVLSDGPAGVEWGNGNLVGSFEDGCLVWRNRRGEPAYFWQKQDGQTFEAPARAEPVKEARRKSKDANPVLPVSTKKTSKTAPEDLSPRSTNSDGSKTSNETAALFPAGMLSSAAMASQVGHLPADLPAMPQQDEVAFGEVKMLLEMARNRLMAGDVYTSMRYITLAQQVQPITASFGDAQ